MFRGSVKNLFCLQKLENFKRFQYILKDIKIVRNYDVPYYIARKNPVGSKTISIS